MLLWLSMLPLASVQILDRISVHAGLKPHSILPGGQDRRAGPSLQTAVLKVMDHTWSFMIAPGGLQKRVQLGTSTAEQSKARSVPLQVIIRRSSKLPTLPWVFPPTGTAAKKQKESFEGKDFVASNCPWSGMLLSQ